MKGIEGHAKILIRFMEAEGKTAVALAEDG